MLLIVPCSDGGITSLITAKQQLQGPAARNKGAPVQVAAGYQPNKSEICPRICCPRDELAIATGLQSAATARCMYMHGLPLVTNIHAHTCRYIHMYFLPSCVYLYLVCMHFKYKHILPQSSPHTSSWTSDTCRYMYVGRMYLWHMCTV